MTNIDCSSAQAGVSVVIYDRLDCGSVNGLGVQERVAACYRWASSRGYPILDRFVSWDGSGSPLPAALSRALDLCTTEAACLLVYSETCLGEESALHEAVRGHLSGREPLTVVGEPLDVSCAVTS